MKVLVRSESRGGFYAGDDNWIPHPAFAHHFKSVWEAGNFCIQNGITDYDLQIRFGYGPEYDLMISNGPKRPAETADLLSTVAEPA
jgi:hypothetical protein